MNRTREHPHHARSEWIRQRILKAALELLATGGPVAVSYRAVADRAGVSLSSVTYHFKSKHDLLGEVYRLHLVGLRERTRLLVSTPSLRPSCDAGITARDCFVASVAHYLEQGVREDRLGSLATFELALERARDPALRADLSGADLGPDTHAIELLRSLGSVAPEVDADLLTVVLNGLCLALLAGGKARAWQPEYRNWWSAWPICSRLNAEYCSSSSISSTLFADVPPSGNRVALDDSGRLASDKLARRVVRVRIPAVPCRGVPRSLCVGDGLAPAVVEPAQQKVRDDLGHLFVRNHAAVDSKRLQ